jgi:hypothetical protein
MNQTAGVYNVPIKTKLGTEIDAVTGLHQVHCDPIDVTFHCAPRNCVSWLSQR